jgi:predicted dehydrogenase
MSCRVLIVGLGQIGMGYDLALDPRAYVYSHARAFSQHPGFELVAAVDPDAKKRETFTAAYGRNAYEDLDLALRQEQPSLVAIAVPTNLHGATLERVLAQPSVNSVLCEKPLSYDLAEARRMVEACAARRVEMFVNYMRRSDRGVFECRQRLDDGRMGAWQKGVVWYSKGFLHNGSHFFNLAQFWLGPMRNAQVLRCDRKWQDVDPEPDVLVEFERGSLMFLSAWEEAFSHYTIELLSTKGRLRYEQGGKVIEWQGLVADPNLRGYTKLAPVAETIETGMDRSQWHVVDQLARQMAGLPANLCTGAEALRTLADMQTIIEQT